MPPATTAPPQQGPPVHLAVASGAQATCLVGSLALMTAGQGIAGWALMMLGGLTLAATHVPWISGGATRGRTWRAESRTAGAVVVLAMLALVGGGGFAAQAVVVEQPWLAALVAVVAGAGFGALGRWWHRRLVPAPA